MSPVDKGFSCMTAIGLEFIVAGCQNGSLSVYRTEDCKLQGQIAAHSSRVSALCSMRDKMGNNLVCSGSEDLDSGIVITNVTTNKKVTEYKHGHSGGVTSLLGLPNNRTLVSGGHDGVICLWDIHRPEASFLQREIGHRIAVSCLRYYEKEDILISGGRDSKICLWKLLKQQDKFGEFVIRIEFFQSFDFLRHTLNLRAAR